MSATERRTTYTVRPESHKRTTCARCQRPLLAGERATVRRRPSSVTFTHAGRTCPARAGVERWPFLR